VPLLLSRHLRSKTQWDLDDAPEFELVKNKKPVAETDLLALTERHLISAEAKTKNTLGRNSNERNDAAEKRVLAAKLVMADQIILATTELSWVESSIKSMKSAIRAASWDTGAPPRLRIITGLGTATVTDRFAD
jgi:hypothetical protein